MIAPVRKLTMKTASVPNSNAFAYAYGRPDSA
jgi:hypothetical protein